MLFALFSVYHITCERLYQERKILHRTLRLRLTNRPETFIDTQVHIQV